MPTRHAPSPAMFFLFLQRYDRRRRLRCHSLRLRGVFFAASAPDDTGEDDDFEEEL